MDILVCGGGVAGVMAAIAASRAGAKTVLVERGGCLGGMWTSGLLGHTLDSANKSGLLCEFLTLLKQEMALSGAPPYEAQKYILENMCCEAGVRVLMHTQISGCEIRNRRIIEVQAASKSGNLKFYPSIVIDGTGDGDVAIMAGCGFEMGHPSDGRCQPMSMIAVVAGLSEEEVRPYIAYPDKPFWDSRKRFSDLIDSLGMRATIGCPSLSKINDSLYYLSVNHVYGKSGINADDLTQATIEARREVYEIVRLLRQSGELPFRSITLATTPESIGVRESRRIHGMYTVTKDDVVTGATHEDAICRVTYWVDIHSLSYDGIGFSDGGVTVKPYDIPWRSLLPVDCDNLLLAGRSISGDFVAHASYRVTGNMAPVGEAAGYMAARAIRDGLSIKDIPYTRK